MKISIVLLSGAVAVGGCKKQKEDSTRKSAANASVASSASSVTTSSSSSLPTASQEKVQSAKPGTVFVWSWSENIGRNAADEGRPEVVNAKSLAAKSLYKPGESQAFGTIDKVEENRDETGHSWRFAIKGNYDKNYSGLLSTEPIPAMVAVKPQADKLSIPLQKAVGETWSQSHSKPWPGGQVKVFSVAPSGTGCEALFHVIGPDQGDQGQQHMLACTEGDKVKSSFASTMFSGGTADGAKFEIRGALDVTGDGAAELLIYDQYYEGASAYWIDFSKSPSADLHTIRAEGA